MTSRLDATAYLRHIGYDGPLAPTIETLRGLHQAHLLAVPFENLDIGRGRPIVLDEAALVDKIVARRRGGFCYELNGAFAALLRALGFDVTLLSAEVVRATGDFGPEFDHLTLLVRLEERWLADVGFGDSFHRPLRLDSQAEQRQDGRAYRLAADGSYRLLQRRDDQGTWATLYRFTLQPRDHGEFAAMCLHHQRSPDSPFTRRRVCTRLIPTGRITLSDDRLITTTHGERRERAVTSPEEFAAALREHFGIDLAE